MRRTFIGAAIAGALALSVGAASAGGGWVPGPKQGYVQFGFSRKTADTSWDSEGTGFDNTGRFKNHDFRYDYLSGEVGLGHRTSATFLVTYLDGREGPDGDLEHNAGPSDAWFGVKVAATRGAYPIAVKAEVRTPVFYDIQGPYTRDLYDADGNFLGHSPEWRGILKHDYTLSAAISHSLDKLRGWWTVETGYTVREGAPADQWPIYGDAGFGVPWLDSHIKASVVIVKSLGNDSPREPDDRFGARPGFNFNNASMARLGVSWLVPLDRRRRWTFEVGYNQWVWGRSARQYVEPFVSVGRSF